MNQDRKAGEEKYDAHIMPSETAARKEREGENFQHKPESEGSLDTTGGYTVDTEGLSNNYAIEPEMYVEVPGDLRAEAEAEASVRSEELSEVNETDEQGKLTTEGDRRGKGPGII
jgi:hypothetical protein